MPTTTEIRQSVKDLFTGEPLAVPRWSIVLTATASPREVCAISAFSAESAWRKFCTQRFHTLLPCRDDYRIDKTAPLARRHPTVNALVESAEAYLTPEREAHK